MPMRIVLFDIDGTLLEAGGAGRRAVLRAFREAFGLEAAIGFSMAGLTDSAIMRRIARESGIEPGRYEAARPGLFSRYADALEEESRGGAGYRRLPGAAELLDALSARREVALGLLTGNLERGAAIKLAAVGLAGHFSFGGYGSDAEERAAIYPFVRARFPRGVDGEEDPPVTIVGDTPHDIAVAVAHGLPSVGVASGRYSTADLRAAGATHLFESLSDTARVLAALDLRPKP